jgi:hypothetical protein
VFGALTRLNENQVKDKKGGRMSSGNGGNSRVGVLMTVAAQTGEGWTLVWRII